MATPLSLTRKASGASLHTRHRVRGPAVFRRSATKKARAVIRAPPAAIWSLPVLER